MDLSEFDYHLPRHLIAQRPSQPRDSSRLMVLHPNNIEHKIFRKLPEHMNEGDILVINDSRVIPARLRGKKETGGKVEVLLVRFKANGAWECLISGKNIKAGTNLFFGEKLKGTVIDRIAGGRFEMRFPSEDDLQKTVRDMGEMPTPPYIKDLLDEPQTYQTVYAKENGSIAAPTAGLHFTKELMNELNGKGVDIVPITLHVSIGTFLPVKSQRIEEHAMEPEHFKISHDSAERITKAKDDGNRVYAVGTTSVKALESAICSNGALVETEGESDLFIFPGYEFKSGIDGLVTNFHLPKSTLIMLVAAFAGRERIMDAYKTAMELSYRFYSFGDCMLIMRG
ncbi:MAG: tRNA preQ1(34) S-adenosylmethionine ribosyltransferase-isomerase QueA [Thermoplasmata archaeon]|nr:MAG: tRNA preQ1(34) S-adenosylmethionine ribosyltransferase-isomerase QueA [Thermoplasmata archaeon]